MTLYETQRGPGAELGNLYYFTWASFLTSFMVLASLVGDYNAASSSDTSTTANAAQPQPVPSAEP